MEKFTTHRGLVAPLDRANVDTDAIIPKQFLISIKRTGFGKNLFDEWRYLDRGEPEQDATHRPKNKDFVLNLPKYQGASILLARKNFACGSSREHAAWAIAEYGFRAVIAPSFGDIYYQNSSKNGLLSIVLSEAEIDRLFEAALRDEPLTLEIDLPAQEVRTTDGSMTFHFDIDPSRKHSLLNGLDEVGATLGKAEQIRAFQEQHLKRFPWLVPTA
ncbi:3-isopropylmalate dehydratase small subunit [Ramlibacter sp.]|uniref:3-isopropylmalate dehydratase small subunit n=1 Tax=Ramlibacter sp. TaxID=1917967 RepID=UPI003D14E71F